MVLQAHRSLLAETNGRTLLAGVLAAAAELATAARGLRDGDAVILAGTGF